MIKKIKAVLFTDITLWFIWFPFRILVQCMPVSLLNLTGRVGGDFLYLFSKKRKLMINKLSFLFANIPSLNRQKINRIARKGLQVFCKRQMENLYWGNITPELVNRMVSIEGIGNVDRALQKGNGAILLGAHFGSHLLPPIALGFKGYKIHQLTGPPLIDKQRAIHRKIFNYRMKESERLPVNFVVMGQSMKPLLDLLNALRRNEMLSIAFDGGEGKKKFQVDLLGHKAFFVPGAFRLSLMSGAPVLPVFTVRQSDDTHRIIIEPPFEFETAENEEKTLAINTAKFAKIFEAYILKHPCHYAMTLMRVEELIKEGALKTNLFQE